MRPYIGMNMINYYPRDTHRRNKSLPSSFRIGDTFVQVADVSPGSPAEAAGLKVGDIIVGVDGKKVTNGIPDVLGCIGLDIGKSIEFEVRRKSHNETLRHTVVTSAERLKGNRRKK